MTLVSGEKKRLTTKLLVRIELPERGEAKKK